MTCSIAYIRNNIGWRLESVKRLETQGLPLQKSMDTMKNASEKLSFVKDEAGESVSIKLQAIIKRNPGFSTITSSCQVHNGEIVPEKNPFLKYARVTSSDEERSFSDYKQNISDKGQSMPTENMGNILIVYCASKNQ
jgi:hypothetical protein